MSINRDGKRIEVQCDTCSETSDEYVEEDFYVMIEEIKSQGWLMNQDFTTREWRHICPTCVQASD